jgi:hypothetical protein
MCNAEPLEWDRDSLSDPKRGHHYPKIIREIVNKSYSNFERSDKLEALCSNGIRRPSPVSVWQTCVYREALKQ